MALLVMAPDKINKRFYSILRRFPLLLRLEVTQCVNDWKLPKNYNKVKSIQENVEGNFHFQTICNAMTFQFLVKSRFHKWFYFLVQILKALIISALTPFKLPKKMFEDCTIVIEIFA